MGFRVPVILLAVAKPKVLVSACLLGRACRFDGRDKTTPPLIEALEKGAVEAVPFCPEEAGGLGTPRPAATLRGGGGHDVVEGRAQVINEAGDDVTEAFLAGGRLAVEEARAHRCEAAYLKERSPSCGCGQVHTDHGVAQGCGVTAALLQRAGIPTISVD